MRNKNVIFIGIIIIIFGGLIGFNFFRSMMIKNYLSNYKPPIPTISTSIAKKQAWTPKLDTVGSLVAINGVNLNTEIAGSITKIHFKSGEFIDSGAPLITLDDRVEQAELLNYQAQLTLAKANFNRQADLIKKGATSSSDYDKAKATKMEAFANLEKTRALIKQKHLVAPFSGKLGIGLVNLGQYVTPGQTNIVSLQSLDPLYIRFYLPGNKINQIHVGQVLHFSTDAFKNKIFYGEISAINSQVSTETNNVLVEATVSNCSKSALLKKDTTLIEMTNNKNSGQTIIRCDTAKNEAKKITDYAFLPGLFSRVSILMPEIQNAIVVPKNAISYSLYGDAIYVIKTDKDGKTKKAYRQFVKTGDEENGHVIIEKGIKAGDEVVNSGQLKLDNGMEVKVNNNIKLGFNTPIDELGQ